MRKSMTARNYQKGISKRTHKLSEYVRESLKDVIKEQNKLFLKEPHTQHEIVVHLQWIFNLSNAFNEDKQLLEWCDKQRLHLVSNVEYKPYK